jgi:hypothetical protein
MNTYFPHALKPSVVELVLQASDDLNKDKFLSGYPVDSGKSAIRLLIRNFSLAEGSRIALPPLICMTVVEAIVLEKMVPVFLDISPITYQLDFDPEVWEAEEFQVLILPHLYGILHPDTEPIECWCKKRRVRLIHDTAQSYNLYLPNGSKVISKGDGALYSFGPGKSLTVCGGGVVFGLKAPPRYEKIGYFERKILARYWKKFLIERCVGVGYSQSKILKKLFGYFSRFFSVKITPLFSFQRAAVQFFIDDLEWISENRSKNWDIINNVWKGEKMPLQVISQKFKYVVVAKSSQDVARLETISAGLGLPFRQVCENVPKEVMQYGNPQKLSTYNSVHSYLYEFSTESSQNLINHEYQR